MPVVTAAAKPGSQPAAVTADIRHRARGRNARLSADACRARRRAPPSRPRKRRRPAQQPARQEEESARCRPQRRRSCPSTPPACRDHLAQSLAVATQRQQPLPVFNPAGIGQPPVALQVATPVGATHWARTWASNWS